jgi:hypothetical protein
MSRLRALMFLLMQVCLWSLGAQNEPISWDSESLLSWSDFEAVADTKAEAVAITSSGLTFGYRVKQSNNTIISFTARVEAQFYPDKSWVKTLAKKDTVLKHEQLHFDITELHARKFRKELSALRIDNNLKQRIQELYNRINLDLDRMQRLYDKETDHSLKEGSQLQWNKDVRQALNALKAYSHPEISREKL